jgi:cytoskeletal protein RodZ
VSPDNLVSFPANGSARPHGEVCAEFCARWRGSDVAEGARLLQSVLPSRVPGALQLAIARALGDLDVPPFATAEEFRAAVRRFAAVPRELRDISDVRRARRQSRLTLDRLALDTTLPAYLIRQLEWGDFREWHHEEWTRRVCYAYARAAGLDPERVHAIVEDERGRQVCEDPAPASAAPDRNARRRSAGFAAAVAVFAAGLLTGGLLVDRSIIAPRADGAVTATSGQVTNDEPSEDPSDGAGSVTAAPSASREVAPVAKEAVAPVGETVSQTGQGSPPLAASPTEATGSPRPRGTSPGHLRAASVMGPASFSPAFSSAGSAVFYHRDEGVGSALVKADTDAATGDLRVISLVQDGARNYHVRPSPDGARIAFDSDRDGERGVYIANADGSQVRRVSGPGFAAVPSWSPDGTRLAFVRGEPSQNSRVWNLWLLDLNANTSVRLTSYRYGQPWGASWFPDGRRLAFSHEDRLTVLDLHSGARRIFRSPRRGRLMRTPAVSPDGRRIAFQVYRDGAWLLDLKDGSMHRILDDPTAEEFAWDATGRKLAFHSRRSGEWSVWIMADPSGPAS